jgi:hypothetical protein
VTSLPSNSDEHPSKRREVIREFSALASQPLAAPAAAGAGLRSSVALEFHGMRRWLNAAAEKSAIGGRSRLLPRFFGERCCAAASPLLA